MRKILLILLSLILVLSSCSGNSTPSLEDLKASVAAEGVPVEVVDFIVQKVSDDFDRTTVDRISYNANLRTSDSGDYVLLVYLTWDVKNTALTARPVLELYAKDFAATVATELPQVSEVTTFWVAPYINGDSTAYKFNCVRNGDKMAIEDEFVCAAMQ